jgi:hypothetical protein
MGYDLKAIRTTKAFPQAGLTEVFSASFFYYSSVPA